MTGQSTLAIAPVDRGASVVGRYAPSPTGRQHRGNLSIALLAWLHARLNDGVFIVRMEDIDQPRVRTGSAGEILEDLKWLGLDWDEGPDISAVSAPYTQSERGEIYTEVLRSLEQSGALFDCYCSRKDVREAASAPHEHGEPVYPGTCRERSTPPEGDRTPSLRCRVGAENIEFEDALCGLVSTDLAVDCGDFIVRRADGLVAYQLATAVDDALMGVTHVLRGRDLLLSTPRQLWLMDLLGLPRPAYWHAPLILDGEGQRLSKRDGSESVGEFQAGGITPETLTGELAFAAGLLDRPEDLTARELCNALTADDFKTRLTLKQGGP